MSFSVAVKLESEDVETFFSFIFSSKEKLERLYWDVNYLISQFINFENSLERENKLYVPSQSFFYESSISVKIGIERYSFFFFRNLRYPRGPDDKMT